jgi:hypothetical protein
MTPIKLEPDETGHIPVKTHYKLYPTMPFGMHKGTSMDRLPHSYLKWLASGKIGSFWQLNAEYILHNEPEPPEIEECVAITGYNSDDLAVDAPYELRAETRAVPGSRWNKEMRMHIVPRTSLKELRVMFPRAKVRGTVPKSVRDGFSKQAKLF